MCHLRSDLLLASDAGNGFWLIFTNTLFIIDYPFPGVLGYLASVC